MPLERAAKTARTPSMTEGIMKKESDKDSDNPIIPVNEIINSGGLNSDIRTKVSNLSFKFRADISDFRINLSLEIGNIGSGDSEITFDDSFKFIHPSMEDIFTNVDIIVITGKFRVFVSGVENGIEKAFYLLCGFVQNFV